RNTKLQENKRYDELVKLLGLDYQKKYKPGKEGDEEFATLRYGRVVVATDQDIDGTGNIFGLLLNFFALFWPGLIERNYVTRFNTPLVRAYPKSGRGNIGEFYTAYTYKRWIQDEFGDNHAQATK